MKVVAYGILPSVKGILAQANNKKHDITLISNQLTLDTAFYAQGKEAVINFAEDETSIPILQLLADSGTGYLITHTKIGCLPAYYIDALLLGVVCANVPFAAPASPLLPHKILQDVAEHTIWLLDSWQNLPSG